MKKNKTGVLKILSYYFKDKLSLILSLITIVLSLFSGWMAVRIPKLVQSLLNEHLPKDTDQQLLNFAWWCIFVIISYALVTIVTSKVASFITARITSKIREDAYGKYLSLDHYYYDQIESGDILSKISRDVEKTASAGINTYRMIFSSIVTLFYAITSMWEISGNLTLSTLGLMLLFPLTFVPLGMLHHKSEAKFVENNAEGTQHLHVSINGIKLIKAFASEKLEKSLFAKYTKKYSKSFDQKEFYMSLMMQMGMMIFSLIQVGILLIGSYFIRKHEVKLPDVIAFFLFSNSLISPIMNIFMISPRVNEGKVAMESISELLNAEPKIELNQNKDYKSLGGEIEFKNVSFKYNDDLDSYQLNNFNYKFEKGKKYAIVGPSGSGKSTLINLIPKFYNVNEGEVLVDKHPLNDINIPSFRKEIGIVQQEIFIFPGTIKENIRYGLKGVSDEDIINAAKQANIHEDILKMDNGYDTQIGENGVKLSGGQRQRVSIARMFLKDPKILILDEATSALDTITEYKIQQSFEVLMKDRTSITIAHRLSTIIDSDQILVIDKGNLVTSGTHNELLQTEGLYKELYKSMQKQQESINRLSK